MEVGICAYCGEEKELCKAHIIPRSFYKLNDNDKYIGISNNGKVNTVNFQNGMKDNNILCSVCDNERIGVFDNYAFEILNNKIPQSRINNSSIFRLTSKECNFVKLRKFFISLIWRASISKHKDFENINLGDKYENIALKMLKGELEIDNNLFCPLIVRKAEDNPLNNLVAITKGRFFNQIRHDFTFPNYYISIVTNAKNLRTNKDVRFSFFDDEFIVFESDKDIFNFEKNFLSNIKQSFLQKTN
ncbi:MAG: hypothetical protein R3Y43_06845 [Alphaproteobacteria bacterium]